MRTDYPVTRHNDADRIMTDRAADRLCGHPLASALLCNSVGDPPIGDSLPERNFTQDLADTVAKRGARQMNSRKEPGITAGKIDIQPFFRGIKIVCFVPPGLFIQPKRNISAAFRKPKPRQSLFITGKQKMSQRGFILICVNHCLTSVTLQKPYGMQDMYSAGFYPFPDQESKWGCRSSQTLLTGAIPTDESCYPSATSNAIMSVKPTEKRITPMLECSPSDISGISSSITT